MRFFFILIPLRYNCHFQYETNFAPLTCTMFNCLSETIQVQFKRDVMGEKNGLDSNLRPSDLAFSGVERTNHPYDFSCISVRLNNFLHLRLLLLLIQPFLINFWFISLRGYMTTSDLIKYY